MVGEQAMQRARELAAQYGAAVQTLRLSSTVLLAVGIPLVLLLSASILHRKQVHS